MYIVLHLHGIIRSKGVSLCCRSIFSKTSTILVEFSLKPDDVEFNINRRSSKHCLLVYIFAQCGLHFAKVLVEKLLTLSLAKCL